MGMSHMEKDVIAWILDIQDSEEFFSKYRGTKWFHARATNRERFADLLSIDALDRILGTNGIRHPDIRLVSADQKIPLSEYVWRDRMVDPAKVARLFESGATVIFGGLHDRHEGVRKLCTRVTRQVSAQTQTNIYLTPPSSQGFKPHWDTHDVFVLQIEGSKRWRIYEGGPTRPLKNQKFNPQIHNAGEMTEEFTLNAGEALYVPRGMMHAATTTDETSLHITLGVLTYTWADLLIDCISEITERSTAWRADLPPGFYRPKVQLELQDSFKELIEGLPDEMDLPLVTKERQLRFEGHHRPRITDNLNQAMQASSLKETDAVKWRSETAASIEIRGERIVLQNGNTREIEFPITARKTLEILLSENPLAIKEIDDGLDWPSRKIVLEKLIREGLLSNESIR